MHRVREYLEHAKAVEAQAARTPDHEVKRQLLSIAKQWRELARQAGDLARSESDVSADT